MDYEIARTFLVVAVAWARKEKFDIVNETERYELKSLYMDVPSKRDRKKGVAVISTCRFVQYV